MFKSLKSGHARTNVYNKSAKIRILQKTKPQSNGLLRMYYLYSLCVCVCVFFVGCPPVSQHDKE